MILPLKSVFFYGAHVRLKLIVFLRFILFFPQTIFSTLRLISKENPDIVHLNTSVHITVSIAIRLTNTPVIWHIRECMGNNKIINYFQKKITEACSDRIIITSNYLRRYYSDNSKIHTVYNSVDLSQFSILHNDTSYRKIYNIDKNDSIVCMLGSVQKEKGHFMLVDIANKILKQKSDVNFLLIGADPKAFVNTFYGKIKQRIKNILKIPIDNCSRMKREVNKYNIIDYFTFTDYHYDIPHVLSEVDILLFISTKPEGFGRPIIEAMAAGKPVISIDIGPTSEIMGKECGILVKELQKGKIASSIISLLNDKNQQKLYGENGKSRVKKYFNNEINNKLIIKLYNDVIAK